MRETLRPSLQPLFPWKDLRRLIVTLILLNIFFLLLLSWHLSDLRLLMAGKVSSFFRWQVVSVLVMVVLVGGGNFIFFSHLIRKLYLLKTQAERTERLAYIGTLAGGLAHEIHNPLNSLSVNLQLLEEEFHSLPSTEGKNIVHTLRQEIGRLEEILTEFLRFTRPPALHLEAKDINRIVNDVLKFIEPESRFANISIVRNFAPDLPPVLVDEKQIKQVLFNLILNANQAMPQGGVLSISTRRNSQPIQGKEVSIVSSSTSHHREHWILVEIGDTGCGIAEKDRNRIFELFYSTKKGGAGLGLSIVQRIIEDHGGKIYLHSTEGKGTIFTLALPQAKEGSKH